MTATADTILDSSAEALRHRLVDQSLADRRISTAAVEAAFRAVPRHAFAPEAELEAAYADDTVKTKFDDNGACLSSLSAPWLQALMIEQAALQAGDRVLEIGSGGYQAALLADIVTPTGTVVTLDIDPEITDRAASGLERAGYDRVVVALGDGEHGWAVEAPYSAIIVCAQAYDIPPAWVDQLAPGGKLIVPLSICGQNRTYTFTADGDHLRATNAIFSGFVPFQGVGGRAARSLTVVVGDTHLPVSFIHADCDDPEALTHALDYPAAQSWAGISTDPGFYLGGLQMYLATRLPGACQIPDAEALVPGGVRRFPPTWSSGGNIGYLAVKKVGDRFDLGSVAFGPDAARQAEQMTTLIDHWDREGRGGPGMTVTVHPRGAADADLPEGCVIDTVHRRIVVGFPAASSEQAALAVPA